MNHNIRNSFHNYERTYGKGSLGIYIDGQRLSMFNGKNTWEKESSVKRALTNHFKQQMHTVSPMTIANPFVNTRNIDYSQGPGLYLRDVTGDNWEYKRIESITIPDIVQLALSLVEIREIDIMETLASIQHDIWSHWMDYLFSKSLDNSDGSVTIPREFVERWTNQQNTSYQDLTEEEKESDRNQVRKFINEIN